MPRLRKMRSTSLHHSSRLHRKLRSASTTAHQNTICLCCRREETLLIGMQSWGYFGVLPRQCHLAADLRTCPMDAVTRRGCSTINVGSAVDRILDHPVEGRVAGPPPGCVAVHLLHPVGRGRVHGTTAAPAARSIIPVGSPEDAPSLIHPACSREHRRPPCRSQHGRKPPGLPKGEASTEPHGKRSRGRSQALLYNDCRLHQAPGYRAPMAANRCRSRTLWT